METENEVLEKEMEYTLVICLFCITQRGITLAIDFFFFTPCNDC